MCWCQATTFPATLIERLPEARRGIACICARCASAHVESLRDAAS